MLTQNFKFDEDSMEWDREPTILEQRKSTRTFEDGSSSTAAKSAKRACQSEFNVIHDISDEEIISAAQPLSPPSKPALFEGTTRPDWKPSKRDSP